MNKLTFFKKREQETQTLLFGSWLLKFWLRRTKWVHSGRLKKPHLKKKVKSIAGNEKKKIDENLLPLGIYPSNLIERRNAFHRAKFAQRIYLRECASESTPQWVNMSFLDQKTSCLRVEEEKHFPSLHNVFTKWDRASESTPRVSFLTKRPLVGKEKRYPLRQVCTACLPMKMCLREKTS